MVKYLLQKRYGRVELKHRYSEYPERSSFGMEKGIACNITGKKYSVLSYK